MHSHSAYIIKDAKITYIKVTDSAVYSVYTEDGRMMRWCWVNVQCRGILLVWIIVGQWPTVLAVAAGGGCFHIFSSPEPKAPGELIVGMLRRRPSSVNNFKQLLL